MPAELPTRKRRPQRREQILAAALALFHERGYHATGIDEIGAAAGITGPGVYRHFRNKEEILETLVRERGEQVLGAIEAVTASDLPPEEMVDELVHSYVTGIVADPSLAVVAMYERRTLSDETRTWLDKMERRNLDVWVDVVRRARPELDEGEGRVVVHAALSLGVAVCSYRTTLTDEQLVALLHPMIVTAVLGRAPAATLTSSRRGA